VERGGGGVADGAEPGDESTKFGEVGVAASAKARDEAEKGGRGAIDAACPPNTASAGCQIRAAQGDSLEEASEQTPALPTVCRLNCFDIPRADVSKTKQSCCR
jgi:hypothetical protein